MSSIPLIAIKAGNYSMTLPFIGPVNFGLFYPFFIVPLIVTVYNNAFNMIAGLNGLEAGSGLVISTGVLLFGILTGNSLVIILTSLLSVCLLAFLIFNFYPAKIFPGDITPFLIGSTLASAVILGNMEKVGVLIIGLYYLEFLLKLRSGFKAQSFGNVNKDGTLEAPYKKTYSITHLIMKLGKGKLKEKQIVMIILLLHLIPLFLASLTILI
jgi:UDP-N-acetylglucosamine--dolichyl-phosphate N-acetylglucosaminephosphotransferase